MADWQLHAHDESNAFRFCPRCGGALERRLLKANEPERLVCGRCGFVFYLDPKIAVGTIITTARDRGLIQGCYLMPSYGRYDLIGELARELLRTSEPQGAQAR